MSENSNRERTNVFTLRDHLAVFPLVDSAEGSLTLQGLLLGVLLQATSQHLGRGVRELNVA